ncbi:MAG TPA: hypothetical protein VH297_03165 [Gaiellaceae bacterium]
MSIGSWWKRMRKQEDDARVHEAEQRLQESAAERHASEHIEGLTADRRTGEWMRDRDIGDNDRWN